MFEGLDKCGKSTQVDLLHRYFEENEIPSHKISFPERSSKSGATINEYLSGKSTMRNTDIHELFSENRWEFNNQIIEMLNSGKHVIADRYAFSGVAYSVAKGLNPDWCILSDRGLVAPDIVFFIDISPEEASKRKGFGEEQGETLYFQKKVGKAFNSLKGASWVTLDGSLAESQLHELIKSRDFSRTSKQLDILWN